MEENTSERNIEQALRKKIEDSIPGAKCLKFVSPGYSGVPDRIILLPGGRVAFVELKRPGKTPRQRQLFVQSRLRRLGFRVFGCVDSMSSVDEVIHYCWRVGLVGRATREKAEREEARGSGDGV